MFGLSNNQDDNLDPLPTEPAESAAPSAFTMDSPSPPPDSTPPPQGNMPPILASPPPTLSSVPLNSSPPPALNTDPPADPPDQSQSELPTPLPPPEPPKPAMPPEPPAPPPIPLNTPSDLPPASSVLGPAAPDELIKMKQQALQSLAPLVDHLEQTPEEKFKTTMMMIQAADNKDLIKEAFDAANKITDDKARAQALLDVVNEINYFTHAESAGEQNPPASS